MVWGCTSDAGKSLVSTALCRWFSDRGLRVAPFKAQNMSNNARVAKGGEMGCAQWFQAKAARREPDVRFNPVLLKPERDTASLVVVMGEVDRELTSMPWRERSSKLWERARPALSELMSENDIVVVEGAGSPAEINLASCDYVNLETARWADARCLLVSDIDRGGAFAHLFGTWSLVPEDLRPRLSGFLLNKFRGDRGLLEPGPSELERRTGVPVVGCLPRMEHHLPDEDAASLDHFPGRDGPVRVRAGVVAWPRISNFDEFRRMGAWPGVSLRLVRDPAEVRGLDLLVLPGSKHVPSDLAWMRSRGLDRAVREFAAAGGAVLGVCGGFQALGRSISDPAGVEGDAEGLGILPVDTVHGAAKIVGAGRATCPPSDGFWRNLSGKALSGYEIRTGRTEGVAPDSDEGRIRVLGNVMGLYLHGAFEDPGTLAAALGGDPRDPDPLEETFDRLAGALEEHVDMPRIASWMEPPARPSPRRGRLCLLTGGVRSGKSAEAERLAREWGGDRATFVATAEGLDDEMRERIRRHREGRPASWETIEEPLDPASALRRARHRVVVLDCATLLVTNLLLKGGEAAVRRGIEDLLSAWTEIGCDLVVVTNEVGWGIVPADPLSREFRDQLGWANQKLAAAASETVLMVSGKKLVLH